ncbi:RNA polymerase sigma factor [Sphingobacterium lactis]|uniref:RNA polymerase sigma factor n=1 Tax=Sphingobacterium lactis TaxID=797291 RepID=UPI003DA33113
MNKTTTYISDKELLDRCEEGSDQGYAILYDRYAKGVFNTIYRLVADLHTTEDILQEVFIDLFRDIGRLKRLENLGAWANRVAINKSISELRKNRMFFVEIGDHEPQDTSENDLSEKVGLEAKIGELAEAIQELSPQARTIVNLYLFEDMSQEEIARMLDISHVAVRSQYHRAKIRIAQNMNKRRNHG